MTPKYVAGNIINICKRIKENSSSTKIFIQTILPVNNEQYLNVKEVEYNFLQPNYIPTVNEQISQTNAILISNAEFEVIELHSLFLNNESNLDSLLSSDGIHINDSGYQVWINAIRPLIKNLNKQ
ncbi:MAG: SGNH/GDSL hydrolase family protein [Candidatus Neomarinimicrobiota bacterium]